jgi:hypothetical protein
MSARDEVAGCRVRFGSVAGVWAASDRTLLIGGAFTPEIHGHLASKKIGLAVSAAAIAGRLIPDDLSPKPALFPASHSMRLREI